MTMREGWRKGEQVEIRAVSFMKSCPFYKYPIINFTFHHPKCLAPFLCSASLLIFSVFYFDFHITSAKWIK